MSYTREQLERIESLEKSLEQSYAEITNPDLECKDGLKRCYHCNQWQHEDITYDVAGAHFCDPDCYDHAMEEWTAWEETRASLNRDLNKEGWHR